MTTETEPQEEDNGFGNHIPDASNSANNVVGCGCDSVGGANTSLATAVRDLVALIGV